MRLLRKLAFAAVGALVFLAVAAPVAGAARFVDVPGLTLTDGSQDQNGRIAEQQAGQASSCDPFTLRFAPTLEHAGTAYDYAAPTLGSGLAHPVCVTITVNLTNCTPGKSLFAAAYLDDHVPADPTENLMGDTGAATTTTRAFSLMFPPDRIIPVVFSERAQSGECTQFGYTADSVGPMARAHLKPAISGTPTVGAVLTGSDAQWVTTPQTPTVARRWMRCNATGAACTAIPGATTANYTVTDADLGHTLRYRNDATDSQATNFAHSGVEVPFIPFATRTGESLGGGDRVQTGLFVRSSVRSQCGIPNDVPSVLQPTDIFPYKSYPVASLLNEPVCMTVKVDPTCGSGGASPSIYAPAFDAAADITTNYAAHSGDAFSDMHLISTALPAAGRREVTVSTRGTSCSDYDMVLGADAPFASARPQVGGSTARTLTSTTGTWSGNPAFRRTWLRCNAAGDACAAIPRATGATYTPTAADTGRRLRVRVSATRGRTVSSDSPPTGVVPARPPAPRRGTTPPVDSTAPVVTLRLGSRNLAKAVKTGRIPVRVTCDEACRASVQVRVTKKLAKKLRLRRKVVLAKAKGSVPAGRRKTLRAKLTRGARRALRRSRSVKVGLRATFTDAAGNSAKKRGKGALKRPRRR